MTDISTLKKDDRIVFSNGHESPVLNITYDDTFFSVYFIQENGEDQDLFFRKETGKASGTHYEIVKVIKNV